MHLLVHCAFRDSISVAAKAAGLKCSDPFCENGFALSLEGSEQQLASFQARYLEGNPKTIVIREDHMAGKFTPKVRMTSTDLGEVFTPSAVIAPVNRTASYMAQYYNFPPPSPTAPKIAIISLGGTYLTADLQYYWKDVLNLATAPTVSYVDVAGATNAPDRPIAPRDGSEENTLDIEIVGGCCPNANITVYFAPNSAYGFYSAISAAISGGNSVGSISWGAPETAFPPSYLAVFNQLFASTKNIVFCTASGDNGSTDGVSGGLPHTDFPASSPNVVACGGTSLTGLVETAWSYNPTYNWGGGGGISSFFLEPNYQIPVVVYPTGTVPSVAYLGRRRGVPDIALNSDPLSGWTIYYNGTLYTNSFGGTSAAAPAMAALLGLINLTYPKGFLVDLYGFYRVNRAPFRDITSGSNDNIPGSVGVYGAGPGYDFVTGLGSIQGTALQKALLSIQR